MSADTKPWRNADGQTLEDLKRGQLQEAREEPKPGRNDGLTDAEGKVMDLLTEATLRFAKLPVEHPSDMPDIVNAAHRCQEILAVRVARRAFPEGWPKRPA